MPPVTPGASARRPSPARRRWALPGALLVVAVLAAGGCGATHPDRAATPRPVVLAAEPLQLDNPQQETVVWPIWGGAFTPDEPVTISARLAPGGAGGSGLVIAGPGEPDARISVELVAEDGGWHLLGRDATTVVDEQTVRAGASDRLAITVHGADVTVTVGEGDPTTLHLPAPLAPDAGAAGLYAYLEPGATLEIREASVSQPLPRHPELGTPLRDLAAARATEVGSALDIWPPLSDLGFESMLAEQFNSAAPTEFYWATTRGEDEDYFFLPADVSVNYAEVHDQTVTGMFLVWDFELPAWVQDLAATGSADEVGQVFDDHISTLVSRYRGKVDRWVVVNEGIWGPQDTGGSDAVLASTVWRNALGDGYIERAFRAARAADPDAELIYNETGAEELGPKSDFLYAMAEDFVVRGVPIDGIGLQFHVDAAFPPDVESVRANMRRFADLGLDIHITELDVAIAGPSEDQLDLQAQLYGDVLRACLDVPGCRSTTVFGFSDRYSWDELGEAAPLLFDRDYAPKPAFSALQQILG